MNSDSDHPSHPDDLTTLYEALRADELRGIPLALPSKTGPETAIHWESLETIAIHPTATERLVHAFGAWRAGSVCLTGLLAVGFAIEGLFWLQRLPPGSWSERLLVVGAVAAGVVLSVLWLSVGLALIIYDSQSATDSRSPSRAFRWAAVVLVLLLVGNVGRHFYRPLPAPSAPDEAWQGALALMSERYTEALAAFARAELTTKDDAELYLTMANLLYDRCLVRPTRAAPRGEQVKLASAAIEYFQKAVALDPRHTPVLSRVAELHYVLGNYDRANATLAQLGSYPHLSSNDRERIVIIGGAIKNAQIASRLDKLTPEEKQVAEAQLDATIDQIASMDERSDASAVLTSLYLTRAAIGDEEERTAMTARAVEANETVLRSPGTRPLGVTGAHR